MEEEKYTLQEAKEELNLQKCKAHGHDFEIITSLGSGDPQGVICTRCGARWKVEE